MDVLLVCEMNVGKKDGCRLYSVGCGYTKRRYDYHYWYYFDAICSRASRVPMGTVCHTMWMNMREYGSMN